MGSRLKKSGGGARPIHPSENHKKKNPCAPFIHCMYIHMHVCTDYIRTQPRAANMDLLKGAGQFVRLRPLTSKVTRRTTERLRGVLITHVHTTMHDPYGMPNKPFEGARHGPRHGWAGKWVQRSFLCGVAVLSSRRGTGATRTRKVQGN